MSALSRQYWLDTPMMRGDEVWQAQLKLNAAGAGLKVDGVFGIAVRDALVGFQKRAGLSPDGIMGPITWARLNGDTGPAPMVSRAADMLTSARLEVLAGFHQRFPGSIQWRLTDAGIEIDGDACAPQPREAALAERVTQTYLDSIRTASARSPVPVELVVATICTESSGRPGARRLEPGCDPDDPERTPQRVSLGLTQTLLSTARSALESPELRLADLAEPAVSIRAGMAYMWLQARDTGLDPPLVAAAYNAGRVRFNANTANRWRLKQYPIGTGAHVDRFVRFFNACHAHLRAFPDTVTDPAWSFATR